ncbi:MAG: hypothetical protein WBO31_14645 [Saprospiraceae bacterium]|nr:hypothetical protein [Saprospiraceae bacterium]
MNFSIFFRLLCIISYFFACGQSSSKQEKPEQENKVNYSRQETKNSNYLKLNKHEILDREGTGMVAFTCLIPEGWNVKDQLYWEYNDATLPIRYKGLFENPPQNLQINSFPDVRAVYSSGPTGTSGYPPPRGILQGLKELVKKERGNIQFKITEEKRIHQSPSQSGYLQGSAIQSNSESGFLRIEYQENNQTLEEEFYGQLDISNMSSQGMVNLHSTIWAANNLYSVKAPKGKLEACRKIALTIKASSRPTLQFYNKFIQVTKILSDVVYQRIYQAGQISKIISQTNDQISKSISDSYWQTQKSNERVNNQFSDYVRGVDRYTDGNQTLIQLPSGYQNAWVNDRGEYILSESSSFNPNTEFNGNWKVLQKNE